MIIIPEEFIIAKTTHYNEKKTKPIVLKNCFLYLIVYKEFKQ